MLTIPPPTLAGARTVVDHDGTGNGHVSRSTFVHYLGGTPRIGPTLTMLPELLLQ
jgi:hypothetical protein